MRGLFPVVASGGHSSSRCAGLSPSRPLLLRSTGSRCAGSAIVAHGPSRSAACGIFLDQGSNPCPLHWQADSQPLRHQGSPEYTHFKPLLLLIKTLFHKLICFLNLVFKETSREEIFSHFTFGHYIEEIPSRIVFLVWGEFFGFVFFWQGWWGGQERSIQAKLK